MTWIVGVFIILSCLGWGALILRAARIDLSLAWGERAGWSFGLGMGIVGWLAFVAALAEQTGTAVLALLCAAGLPGLMLLGLPRRSAPVRLSIWGWALLALLAAVFAGDLIEGLAPPSDADSLAYHYDIPRRILREGRLIFVPRAVDGAVPLLVQMTYLVALGLGGEQAMTLWCGLSGWAVPLLTYGLARRHLSRDWSLAAALAMASVPAILYGAGSGQVETRLAVFTVIAVMATAAARQRGSLGWAVVAGLAAGFAMASKYPALVVAFLCGLALLVHGRGLRLATAFGGAALLAGTQWYGWNWWNTGDPMFPVLYGILPYPAEGLWTPELDAVFREWSREIEAPLPRRPLDILLYPLTVTFAPPQAVDSGRTGLGFLPVLLAPFAAAGAWRRRRSPAAATWLLAGTVIISFYLIWSVFGASQRVRHYLPFMPLIVVGLLTCAERASGHRVVRLPLMAGLGAALLIQAAGQAVFVRNFVSPVLQNENRDDFIRRNIAWGFAVIWANTHLPASAKVATHIRQWLYPLERETYFLHPLTQAVIDIRHENADVEQFWRQSRTIGITHFMLPDVGVATRHATQGSGYFYFLGSLIRRDCLRMVETISGPPPNPSRTLGGPSTGITDVLILEMTPETCGIR